MKAVVVFDMPDGANADDYYVKSALVLHKGDKPFQVDKVAVEFYNFPLRPLPQKKDTFGKLTLDKMAEYIGYNKCLEELEK